MNTYQNPITGMWHELDMDDPKPGIYGGVSHFDYLKIRAVSRSSLFKFRKAPEYLLAPDDPPGDSMILGTQYHAYVFERDTFGERFVEGPRYRRSNAEKDAYKALCDEYGGAEYVYRSSDLALIEAMYASLTTYEKAHSILRNENPKELTVIFVHPDTGLVCKMRVDIMIPRTDVKKGWIIDLKTTKNATVDAFRYSVRSYGYDLQSGFYVLGCSLTPGLEQVDQFAIVAQEKTDPYLVRSINMREYIGENIVESHRLLTEMKAWIDGGRRPVDGMHILEKYF